MAELPKINKTSRLNFTKYLPDISLNQNGFSFWDLIDFPEIPIRNDDIGYEVLEGDRADSLATKYYGDPEYWFVIALGNNLELLPVELIPGNKIRIPSPVYIKNEFKNVIKRT